MSESEKYYYTFHFVDGSTYELTRNNNDLTAKLKNTEKERILIDDVIINLSNVTKIEIIRGAERKEYEFVTDL